MSLLNHLFVKSYKIHFCGIGGIGMSALALLLANLGYYVQGSDTAQSYVTDMLEKKGVKVFLTQDSSYIQTVDIFVKSSAIKDTNPELIKAKELGIKIITRTELLAEFMKNKVAVSVSGTHGKTTTTSLTASMLQNAGLDPTIINGGMSVASKVNASIGNGEFVVAEADESDATFIKIPSTIAVVTNIDPEHLDHYGSFENAKKAFLQFVTQVPFYGFSVLCIDHPEVLALSRLINNREFITYGIDSGDADVKAVNIKPTTSGSCFDVNISTKLGVNYTEIKDVTLGIHGIHNVLNSLASIAIAAKLGVRPELIAKGFEGFVGIKRRFITTGEYNGTRFIDDYAHHPVEIKATLKTAKSVVGKGGKVIAIFQPHRFSRLQNLFDEFAQAFVDADVLYITDVYAAGEDPIKDINTQTLIEKIKQNIGSSSTGCHKVFYLKSPDLLLEIAKNDAKNGDILIFLGAGNISNWAYELPAQLAALHM